MIGLWAWASVVALFLPAELRKALDAYDFGEFETACTALEPLRYNESFDAEARLVTMKYLGACRHVVGDKSASAAAFNELLDLDPSAQLDPVQFPPDMVEFFAKLKARRTTRAPEPPPIQVEPPPPVARTSVSWGPFGAGQFKNGQRSKGNTLAVLQGLSLAAGIIGLGLFEAEKENGELLRGGEFKEPDRAELLHRTYLVGFAAFAGLWIYGIVDASANARTAWIAPTPDGLAVGGAW